MQSRACGVGAEVEVDHRRLDFANGVDLIQQHLCSVVSQILINFYWFRDGWG